MFSIVVMAHIEYHFMSYKGIPSSGGEKDEVYSIHSEAVLMNSAPVYPLVLLQLH